MTRVSPVAWLVGVAVVLIVAFVGSTILVQRNAARLDEHAAIIVNDAAPGVTELAAARTEMRHLELGIGRYLGARLAGNGAALTGNARAQIGRWRASVDAHLAAHARMPFFDGEREMTEELDRAKERVFDDVGRVLAHIDAGRLTEARTGILGKLDDDANEVDRLIAQLIALNNENASASARQMADLRHRSTQLAWLLDALSVLLGAAFLAAAVRSARLYNRTLDERRRLAEARASELDHFAARVAHDLKAPLASVMLGSTVAAESPSETHRALEKIQRTSRLMGEMIDALLAAARAEAQGLVPATPVARVIDVLVDEVRPAAETMNAKLCVEPFPATAAVTCGPGVLASVLSNLLQNAVKYIGDAEGARIITLRVIERATVVRFEVDDTGPGVPPALTEHVFERYVRGDRSSGLGLGLATVKHLVENAGGRLGMQSRVGKGSCFWVELPRATPGSERVAS